MKCHYEVLGVPRTANDDEIKKSYRKLALRWHPDKNLDNPEEANQQFLRVQAAYDVLSDMHERAWYDNHREQILRGGHTDYEDNSLDVFAFFTTSCYKGYGDDPGGFYAVYGEVFHKLATEEVEFLETEEEFETIPKFGDSQSDYDSVVRQFYGHWEGFCTKKSYAWLNPHNLAEIRDRRVLKAIEKENKKVQQKARKERNEEIRSLVLFVKKRDRRVLAYKKLLEEKATQNRLKSQQNRLEQIRRHQEEIERNSSNHFNEAYEEQLRKLEASYADSSEEDNPEYDGATDGLGETMAGLSVGQDENGDESFYVDDLYCVACDKMFTNRKSYENHESSRKHRQNVELLRQEMREESALDDGQLETVKEEENIIEEETQHSEVLGTSDEEAIGPEPAQEVKSKSKKNKGKKKVLSHTSVIKSSDDERAAKDDDTRDEPDLIGLRLGKKSGAGALDASDEDTNWTGNSGNKKSKKGKAKAKADSGAQKSKTVAPPKEPEEAPVEMVSSKANGGQHSDDERDAASTEQSCVTCNVRFPSKNKLFEHLKKTGHSVYIDKLKSAKAAATTTGGGTKGKRRGK